jgi:selenocysteine lyase/cysteine desulfurase
MTARVTNAHREPETGSWALSDLRAAEFSRLDRRDEVYLDYTGSALYADSHVRRHAELLRDCVLRNPHSDSSASRATTGFAAEARARVLRFLDADPSEYVVCFTPNATGALRLVGEAYPFTPRSDFVLSADNHNSVNGIREFARRAGAAVTHVLLDAELRLRDAEETLQRAAPRGGRDHRSLFALPAQSNFSGVQHPLALVHVARELGYDVLLDAASYVPANSISLREVPADFVCLSFYKIFGYPTGIGALVARHEALERLRRPWFSGGTIDFVSVQADRHQMKRAPEVFEDGTANFAALPALGAGFDLLDRIGMPVINRHVRHLTQLLLRELSELRHANDRPVVVIHGPACMKARGGTVAFNVLDEGGVVVPFGLVEARALAARVAVRSGCFCNPGAAEHAFGFTVAETAVCLEKAQVDGPFSLDRFAQCMAPRPVGAVRMSLGLANNDADVRRGVAVVADWRDQNFTANAT